MIAGFFTSGSPSNLYNKGTGVPTTHCAGKCNTVPPSRLLCRKNQRKSLSHPSNVYEKANFICTAHHPVGNMNVVRYEYESQVREYPVGSRV